MNDIEICGVCGGPIIDGSSVDPAKVQREFEDQFEAQNKRREERQAFDLYFGLLVALRQNTVRGAAEMALEMINERRKALATLEKK